MDSTPKHALEPLYWRFATFFSAAKSMCQLDPTQNPRHQPGRSRTDLVERKEGDKPDPPTSPHPYTSILVATKEGTFPGTWDLASSLRFTSLSLAFLSLFLSSSFCSFLPSFLSVNFQVFK